MNIKWDKYAYTNSEDPNFSPQEFSEPGMTNPSSLSGRSLMRYVVKLPVKLCANAQYNTSCAVGTHCYCIGF